MFEIGKGEEVLFSGNFFLSICGEKMGWIFMKFGKQRDQFRISMQTAVENPIMTIESFNGQFQLGEKGKEAVKWCWGW